MNLLKQSTAATIKLGPFVDDTDGKTAETALTIGQADIRLSKNGGDIAQTNNATGATHDELGYYNVPLDATDTNTLGRLLVAVHESGALPVWQEFLVVTANVYDTLCSTDTFDVNVTALADDVITAAKFDESTAYPLKSADTGSTQVARVGADSDTLETLSDEIAAVKAETAAILVDTGTTLDGNITAILADTNEVQAELADGGRTDLLIDAIKAKTDNLPADPADDSDIDAQLAAIKAETAAILVDTGTTLDAKINTIDGIVDDILVDTGTTLDTLIKDIPTNAELATALGTADDAVLAAVAAAKVVIDNIHDTDLPAVKAETALIVEDTGTTLPALLETIDNFLDTEVAAILEDTGNTLPATLATIVGYTDGIAGDVWSHAKRTLTVPAVAAAAAEDGTTLTLYKDADINIEFTGLTIPTGAKKVVFTIKDNLDDADTAAALQATYQLTDVPAETHTLNYINSAVPPVLTTPVTFTVDTDSVEFDMTAAAAYYLPRYERGYLHWDLKLITATTVQILQQGLVQIVGTSTRAVA